MKKVELIVPCYNEEECVALFYCKVNEVFEGLAGYDYVITYIDDGSTDGTLDRIKEVQSRVGKEKIQYIALSRNFGKESAIYAGLSESSGDYVALLDADLQHPPELLKNMLFAIEEEGYDRASARRISRKGEPRIRSFFSRAFYHMINRITGMNLVSGSTDYCLMTRCVVDAIISMRERERFTKGIYSWVGFKNKWIEYENVERAAGKTKWSFRGLLRYAYSGFVAFATTPLRGAVYLGMLIVIFAIVYAVYTFVSTLVSSGARTGYATILITILLLGGVIISLLGMVGEYMARIYMEVKSRPIYFAREKSLNQDVTDNASM